MSANDRQVGGDHYRAGQKAAVQHWDTVVTRGLDYFQGQITSYVERCWDKMGVEDLEKAGHYIEKYIEVSREQGRKGRKELEALAVQARVESAVRAICRLTGETSVCFPDGTVYGVDGKPIQPDNGEAPGAGYVQQDPDRKVPSGPQADYSLLL